jgi:hypothetical protein
VKGSISLLTLLIAMAPQVQAQPCAPDAAGLPESSFFVGYTRPGEAVVHAAARVTRGQIEPYDGRHLTAGTLVYDGLDAAATPLAAGGVNAFVHRLGPDHCVYQATLPLAADAGWRLWVSERSAAGLRLPTAPEQERFRRYRPNCIQQFDLPEDERPPCVRAELIAVSDFDADANPEFWHSVPYTWDTGLSVLEESGNEPVLLVAACPGCSD